MHNLFLVQHASDCCYLKLTQTSHTCGYRVSTTLVTIIAYPPSKDSCQSMIIQLVPLGLRAASRATVVSRPILCDSLWREVLKFVSDDWCTLSIARACDGGVYRLCGATVAPIITREKRYLPYIVYVSRMGCAMSCCRILADARIYLAAENKHADNHAV